MPLAYIDGQHPAEGLDEVKHCQDAIIHVAKPCGLALLRMVSGDIKVGKSGARGGGGGVGK